MKVKRKLCKPTGQKTKSKRTLCQWSQDAMNAALLEIHDGDIGIRAAAKKYGIPRGTVQDRIHNRVQNGSRIGRPTQLCIEDEQKLIDFAGNRAALGIGCNRKAFMTYAGDLAKKRNRKFKHGSPSDKWWRLMNRRHRDLTLRKPEPTASIRHSTMNPAYVSSYFAALRNVLDEHNLLTEPSRLWNMDETGCSLSHTPGKVCAKTGAKYLQSRVSGNRETITLICSGNAAGTVIPPHMIVKGKTTRALMSVKTQDAPPGTKFSVSDSGWTKQGLALMWFKEHFLQHIGHDRPQVLIMDGHNSHNFIELIDCARENDIILIELPEHTSHHLQPFDKSVFGPLKKAYNNECTKLMSENPGVQVCKGNFCSLLSRAWRSAVTSKNMQSGFRSCGIFPFCPEVIPKEAFQPNAVTSFVDCLQQNGLTETSQHTSNAEVDNSFIVTTLLLPPSCAAGGGAQVPVSDEAATTTSMTEASDNMVEAEAVSSTTAVGIIQESVVVDGDGAVTRSATSAGLADFDTGQSSSNLPVSMSFDSGETFQQCPPDLALLTVELVVGSDTIATYKQWAEENPDKDYGDQWYKTWRIYTDQINQAPETVMVNNCLANTASSTLSIADVEETCPLLMSSVPASCDENVMVSNVGHSCTSEALTTATSHAGLMGQKRSSYFPFSNSSHPDDSDADVLKYPLEEKVRKKKTEKKGKYFILTSNEVISSKQEAAGQKEKAEKKKAERQMQQQKRHSVALEAEKETCEQPAKKKKEQEGKPAKDTLSEKRCLTSSEVISSKHNKTAGQKKKVIKNKAERQMQKQRQNSVALEAEKETSEQPAKKKKEQNQGKPSNKNVTEKRVKKGRKEEKVHCGTENVVEAAERSDESYYCVVCRDDAEEDMIRCLQCQKWVHTACAGVGKTERFYVCDFCTIA